MAEYIERETLAKNMCKTLCRYACETCTSDPKNCDWPEMQMVLWDEYGHSCSNCGVRIESGTEPCNFYCCPNCGAKMNKGD